MIAKVQFSLEAVQEVEIDLGSTFLPEGIVRRSLHDDEGGKIQAVAVYDENDDVLAEYSPYILGRRRLLGGTPLTWELARAIENAALRAAIELPTVVGGWQTVGAEGAAPYEPGWYGPELIMPPLRYRLEYTSKSDHALRLNGSCVPELNTTEDMPIFRFPEAVRPPDSLFGSDGLLTFTDVLPIGGGLWQANRTVINREGLVYRYALGPPERGINPYFE